MIRIGTRSSPMALAQVERVHAELVAGCPVSVCLVFAVAYDPARHGEPVKAEPHKCVKIAWTQTALLPSNTYPYTAAWVRTFRDGEPFALSGWR